MFGWDSAGIGPRCPKSRNPRRGSGSCCSAGHARRASRQRCAGCSLSPSRLPAPLLGDLQLIATELLTNALRAGAGWVESELRLDGRAVELSVHDDAPGLPRRRHPEQTDESGRGLELIEAIARTWGVRHDRDTGKTVWAILRIL